MNNTYNSIRNKLYRRGFKLVTVKDSYGCIGYVISDQNNFVVGGHPDYNHLTLDECAAWIKECDNERGSE